MTGINITILSPSVFRVHCGLDVAAIGHVGRKNPSFNDTPSRLSIPWDAVQENSGVFSLLSWRTRISTFCGRDDEIKELYNWATSDPAMSIKFIIGESGVGKTRLAAEFAEKLMAEKWSAGFLDVKTSVLFEMNRKGTLLIIDYPEAHLAEVIEFLSSLSGLGSIHRLRILFLTRQAFECWQEILYDCKVITKTDHKSVFLRRIEGENARFEIFSSALEKTCKKLNSSALGWQPNDFSSFVNLKEYTNTRILIALAVHGAHNPDDIQYEFSGSDVLMALSEIEKSCLRNIAKEKEFVDESILAVLLVLAAISGTIDSDFMERLIHENKIIGVANSTEFFKKVKLSGIYKNSKILAPKLDLFTSAFIAAVIQDVPTTTGELVWQAVERNLPSSLRRLEIICYNMFNTPKNSANIVNRWLGNAILGNPMRCRKIGEILTESPIPFLLLDPIKHSQEILLQGEQNLEERARCLHNLAICLHRCGNLDEAQKIFAEAAELARLLIKNDPDDFEPLLAEILCNQGNCLSDGDDQSGAVMAINQTVNILYQLWRKKPESYEQSLISSLINLADCKSDGGDEDGALKAMQDAIEIWQHQHRTGHGMLESTSIFKTRTSNHLDNKDHRSQTIKVYTRTQKCANHEMKNSPFIFELELVHKLIAHANRLSKTNDFSGALMITRLIVVIKQLHVQKGPGRLMPNLLKYFENMSKYLKDKNLLDDINHAINRVIEMRRSLAQENPARFNSDLARNLVTKAACLHGSGRLNDSCKVIQEAVEILRCLSRRNNVIFEYDIAMSLRTMGKIFLKMSKTRKARDTFKEAQRRLETPAKKTYNSKYRDLNNLLLKDIDGLCYLRKH